MDTKPDCDIVFYGAAHVDRVGRTDAPPLSGRSNPGRFQEWAGGASFNTASLIAACGLRVGLSTVLGDDASGHSVRTTAKERRVELLFQQAQQTATYTAVLDPQGDLVIALADMVAYDAFKAPAFLLATEWVIVDANLPEPEIQRLIKCAAQSPDIHLAALAVSVAKVKRLDSIIDHLNCLFANVGEVLALTGAASAREALDVLSRRGLSCAVVTEGAESVWFLQDGRVLQINVPTVSHVVDVTGAGDALAAITLTGLMRGLKLHDAVEYGIKAAQAVLAVEGPYRADIAAVASIPLDN